MGCDIHAFAEKRNDYGVYEAISRNCFDSRSYSVFGFLAGVRNYSDVTPIAEPRGIPKDVSDYVICEHEGWGCDAHTSSWLSVDELLAFDYEASMEDRRVTKRMPGGWIDCGATSEAGEGQVMTYREFLGQMFFEELEHLKSAGADRVVFWFDN